jgi:magnesium-transporting ATPase (P-type)
MKKKILTTLFFIPALAQSEKVRITNPLLTTSFQEMITRIGNWIFTLAIGILPIMILIGGYMMTTGGANPKKIALGRKIIIYALIGFVIVMLTKGIIALIKTILGI